MPGVTGVTVVTNACAFYTTRAAAGASGARHSPRPLIFRGQDVAAKLALIRGEIAKVWLRRMPLLEIRIRDNSSPARCARPCRTDGRPSPPLWQGCPGKISHSRTPSGLGRL